MKRLSLIASALAVLGLTACEKGLVEDIADVSATSQVTNSVLQVRTRSGGMAGSEATVAYPVTVYVFQCDECRAVQTIGDEGQMLNIPLVEGAYSVFAIGGASVDDYVLPDASDALTSSAIALREGHEHSDLMAASATVTLIDGGTNTVTLGMTRKTMLIQDVTIKKIPTAATAVSVTIAPLWQALNVSGTYSTMNGSSTIALTRQEDGRTWQNAASACLQKPGDSSFYCCKGSEKEQNSQLFSALFLKARQRKAAPCAASDSCHQQGGQGLDVCHHLLHSCVLLTPRHLLAQYHSHCDWRSSVEPDSSSSVFSVT